MDLHTFNHRYYILIASQRLQPLLLCLRHYVHESHDHATHSAFLTQESPVPAVPAPLPLPPAECSVALPLTSTHFPSSFHRVFEVTRAQAARQEEPVAVVLHENCACTLTVALGSHESLSDDRERKCAVTYTMVNLGCKSISRILVKFSLHVRYRPFFQLEYAPLVLYTGLFSPFGRWVKVEPKLTTLTRTGNIICVMCHFNYILLHNGAAVATSAGLYLLTDKCRKRVWPFSRTEFCLARVETLLQPWHGFNHGTTSTMALFQPYE